MNLMIRKWAKKVAMLASALELIAIKLALAQAGAVIPTGNGTVQVNLTNPLGNNSTLQSVVGTVTKFLILIAVPLTTIMALVGAFQMLTSAGDPEKFAKGQKTLVYAAIGFFVVLVAGSIASLIRSIFSS
jgi:hypothetical protein